MFHYQIHSCPSVTYLHRLSETQHARTPVCEDITIEMLEERRLNQSDAVWSLADCSFFQRIRRHATQDSHKLLDSQLKQTDLILTETLLRERVRIKQSWMSYFSLEERVYQLLCCNKAFFYKVYQLKRGYLKPTWPSATLHAGIYGPVRLLVCNAYWETSAALREPHW